MIRRYLWNPQYCHHPNYVDVIRQASLVNSPPTRGRRCIGLAFRYFYHFYLCSWLVIFTFEGCIHLNPVAVAIFVHAQGLISNPSVWRDRFVLNSKYFNTDYNLLWMVYMLFWKDWWLIFYQNLATYQYIRIYVRYYYKSGRHTPQIKVHIPQINIKALLHELLWLQCHTIMDALVCQCNTRCSQGHFYLVGSRKPVLV